MGVRATHTLFVSYYNSLGHKTREKEKKRREKKKCKNKYK